MQKEGRDRDQIGELLHQICDRETLEAIDRLKLVNEAKCAAVKDMVVKHYNTARRPVDYQAYMKIIEGIDKQADVQIRRRNNLYDLEDIDGIDNL
ncbi:hypothetical protein PAPHI01_0723 [Pancytospora philotis]|nr:hypothetical protein PAPHI01_0723 [Pancytospora philotis]